MNNQQFRRLVLNSDPTVTDNVSATAEERRTTAYPLSSRIRADISMTPRRTVGNGKASDVFARQMKEQKSREEPQRQKKFRSLEVPRGTRLAAGYTDRSQQLREEASDERANQNDRNSASERVGALEEMKKLGQIDQNTFENLRDQITGGDLRNAHLVKGLDRQLLARARAGEDVYGASPSADNSREEPVPQSIEEQLDDFMGHETAPVQREKREKRGSEIVIPTAGKKRRRDDIIQELKEARAKAALEQKSTHPKLGVHFKKITGGNLPGTSRVEVDEIGREVLIVVDATGKVKRKIKKRKFDSVKADGPALPMPDAGTKPLGMEVPVNPKAKVKEDSESEDIFIEAGTEYDPLGIGEDDSSSVQSDEQDEGVSDDKSDKGTLTGNPLSDSSIVAAIKRATSSKATGESNNGDAHYGNNDSEQAAIARIRARLADGDRDEDDLDMGFGNNRLGDQEDGEERSVKLSNWTGLGAEADDEEPSGWQNRGGQKQRKRGKKKTKGNKNDASAVLGVLERRRHV